VRGTLLLGHDEEALRRGPARSVLLLVHAHDLHLAGDGSAVGASGHAQVHAGVDVAQSNVGTPHPAVVALQSFVTKLFWFLLVTRIFTFTQMTFENTPFQ